MIGPLIRCAALLVVFLPAPVDAQEWLDRVDQSLVLQSPGGAVRADLGVVVDLEVYAFERPAPGLVFAAGPAAFNPRLTLLVDSRLGDYFSAFVEARIDRGFDPLSSGRDARLDEYLLRYHAFGDGRLNVQVGKFATVVGAWVPRHLSWDNPFLNAPIPYENVTTITDHAAPPNRRAFLIRRTVPDKKFEWVPAIWGPAYSAGVSVFGSSKRLDYALEVKNRALSARPSAWSPTRVGWAHPSISVRTGYRPSAAWSLGVSYSRGAYLLPDAAATTPAGRSVGDYRQTTFGSDFSYARRHWQLWGEVVASRFDVPSVGQADTWAYFVEAKYKATPQLFLAWRWGQQVFGSVADGFGSEQPWDGAIRRAETSLGYRFTRHLQVKLQYGYGHEDRQASQGRHLAAGQLTLKF